MSKRQIINIKLMFIVAAILIPVSIFATVKLVNYQNIVRNRSVYSEHIYNSLSSHLKPITVGGELLSKNQYLIELLKSEIDKDELYSFISKNIELMDCDGLDIVASKSLTCYQTGGTQVVMEEGNDRDKWYFDLLSSGQNWSTEMYYDSNYGVLYIYYNIIVKDVDDTVLGVLGFLISYDSISKELGKFLDKGIVAYLVDDKGVIYLHPDQSKIGAIDIYDYYGLLQKSTSTEHTQEIKSSKRFLHKLDKIDGFLVVEYK